MQQSTSTAWNTLPQQVRLIVQFPYMFREESRDKAYTFFTGWMPTFTTLCERIDGLLQEDKRNFLWTRIREKFGAPSLSYEMRGRARHAIHAHRPDEVRRIYCAESDLFDPAAVAIQELVLLSELKLRESCILCGQPSIITNVGGPWASLCDEHRSCKFLKRFGDASLWEAAKHLES